MAETRPKLEVVGSSSARESAPSGPRSRFQITSEGLAWVLGVLLILAVAMVGAQQQHTQELEARIGGLEAELGTAQRALAAHQRHLQDVRTSVAELNALVSRDPVPEPPPRP